MSSRSSLKVIFLVVAFVALGLLGVSMLVKPEETSAPIKTIEKIDITVGHHSDDHYDHLGNTVDIKVGTKGVETIIVGPVGWRARYHYWKTLALSSRRNTLIFVGIVSLTILSLVALILLSVWLLAPVPDELPLPPPAVDNTPTGIANRWIGSAKQFFERHGVWVYVPIMSFGTIALGFIILSLLPALGVVEEPNSSHIVDMWPFVKFKMSANVHLIALLVLVIVILIGTAVAGLFAPVPYKEYPAFLAYILWCGFIVFTEPYTLAILTGLCLFTCLFVVSLIANIYYKIVSPISMGGGYRSLASFFGQSLGVADPVNYEKGGLVALSLAVSSIITIVAIMITPWGWIGVLPCGAIVWFISTLL